ncbi:MAG: glucokinase [Chitinophagaceae bacterium]
MWKYLNTRKSKQVISYMKTDDGHVSWERLVGGPGLVNIYQFLHDMKPGDDIRQTPETDSLDALQFVVAVDEHDFSVPGMIL